MDELVRRLREIAEWHKPLPVYALPPYLNATGVEILEQAADALTTLTAELAAIKRQMLAVLVRDLGHDPAPLYGFAPIRHQFAWTMATDGLSAEEIAQRVEESKARAVDDGEPFVGYLDRRERVSTLTAALEGLVAAVEEYASDDWARDAEAMQAARAALREVGR